VTSRRSPTIAVMDQLVGLAEIRRMLGGISRQRAYQLTSQDDFPEPEAELAMGKVWSADKVRQWATTHNRAVIDEPS
jgi:prophage regulatory protein